MLDLEVDRKQLQRMRAVEAPARPLEPGEARLGIDRFGLTTNNITYAVFGESMGYWQFFPAGGGAGGSWGRVPVWGFADVIESEVAGLHRSTRVYGYFPMSTELVVRPGRIDDRGFTDLAAHRQPLPSVYNRYSFSRSEPIYSPDREPQQTLLWPLFITSFVVDDFLGDHQLFGASQVVISSASAKTSVAAAFLLADRPHVEVVGLTSPANLEFVRSLDCYHRVIGYGEVAALGRSDACYIDVAGRADITHAVHTQIGARLRYSMVVGDTHWDHRSEGTGRPPGPNPTFLFAPDQITKRRREWGRDGFEQRVADSWNRFDPWTDSWLTVRDVTGAAGVESAYRDLLGGRVDPRIGHVCTLGGTPG